MTWKHKRDSVKEDYLRKVNDINIPQRKPPSRPKKIMKKDSGRLKEIGY